MTSLMEPKETERKAMDLHITIWIDTEKAGLKEQDDLSLDVTDLESGIRIIVDDLVKDHGDYVRMEIY